MQWIPLTDENQLGELIAKSAQQPQVIFKHSTRCSISSVALKKLEKEAQPAGVDFYLLDLIAYRALSNKVAQQFSVPHESPQVLLIRNGSCVYNESHFGISMNEIRDHAAVAPQS